MKTIIKHTNSLIAARVRLGLTQEQMAMQLGLSRSMIKMVETNRRVLSSNCLIKLAAMEIQLAAIEENKKQQLPATMQRVYAHASTQYDLETTHRENRCRHQANQLETRLKKMEEDHRHIQNSLHNLDEISKIDMQPGEPWLKGIDQMRAGLVKKLSRCSLQEQAVLKTKIALLHAEATLNKSIRSRYVHKNENQFFSPLKQTNMNYTVSLITSRADCQELINMANAEKDALAYKKTGLERQRLAASSNSVTIEADLAAVTAELEALQAVFNGLPEGPTKDEMEARITKVAYRKFLLEQRKNNYGVISLVEKEYDIACADQSIAETDAFIIALTARFNELPV